MSPTVKLFPDQSQWKGSITLNLKEEIPKNVELYTKGVFIDHSRKKKYKQNNTLEINYFGIDCITIPGNLLK